MTDPQLTAFLSFAGTCVVVFGGWSLSRIASITGRRRNRVQDHADLERAYQNLWSLTEDVLGRLKTADKLRTDGDNGWVYVFSDLAQTSIPENELERQRKRREET